MSYNYDVNPWDDNYTANNNNNQQNSSQSNAGYGNYSQTTGASNYNYGQQDPYAANQQQQQEQYQYQDQQQYSASNQQQEVMEQQQQQQQQQEPMQAQNSQPGFISRFLRQHVPFCGSIMDTLSSINLPFIDALVQHINRDLLISKIFYFFFYSAFGSLFPLMGVYFKQLGMNPAQVGILTGVRPFIEIFSAPFWHSLAERFHKSKALLLFSLLSWIVFTYSLAHIRPPASACVAFNDSEFLLYTPYSANDLSNYDVGGLESIGDDNNLLKPMSEEGGNEMFMNKPPLQQQGVVNEKEGKDAILASEENQNDQRKRRKRRKKRQVFRYSDDADEDDEDFNENVSNDDANTNTNVNIKKKKFLYSIINSNGENDNSRHLDDDDLDVGLDLENDFEDKLLISKAGADSGVGQTKAKRTLSFLDRDLNDIINTNNNETNVRKKVVNGGGDDSDGFRYKRSMKETDDLLGESDEPEPEEERTTYQQQQQQRQKSKGNNRNEEERGDSEQEEAENSDININKMPQVAAPNIKPATTTAPIESASSSEMFPENQEGRTDSVQQKSRRIYKQRHKTPPTHIVGMSPITVEYAANYNKDKHSQFVTPMFSTIVYKLDDIKEVFFLLLLLISLGEFFSAPALTLADSATLGYLGDNTDLYGRQRLFGSLSWAITLLLVGMALDNATSIADHPCGPHPRERSYTVCFAIFSLLMACALLTATQFRFTYPKNNSGGNQALIVASTTDSKTVVTKTIDGSTVDDLYASTQPRSIFNTAPPVNAPPPNATECQGKEKFEFLEKWKSAVFAQNTRELPEWVNVFRQFKNSLHLTYLFITWFLGCGVGLVFTFLFWHLQDVGGTPTLFGICSVINHISEILAYFFSFSFIKRFGHTKVLSFGLGCNVIRFLYVAFLTNPYYALPFELVQGITHAACFAACCSYISHVSKPELRTSTQGVMQGLHHGIGRACGTLIGGYMINAIGSRASFCIYGLLSGCVLAGFLYVRKKASELKDEEVRVDDSEALGGYGAPQGVPSAIPVSTQQDIDYQW